MSVNSKWYVIHTYSGYENKVATNIEKIVENRGMQDEILDVRVPTEIVTEVRESEKTGKVTTKEVERKIFPGYVLVKVVVGLDENDQPKMSDEAWYVIRNTRGCTGFVGPDSKPVPLTDDEVIALGVEKRVVEVTYEVGDLVKIIEGSFSGFSGIVQEIDTKKGIVKVMVSAVFGKETLVEIDLDKVASEII